MFLGRSIHIHTRYHFIRKCVDKGLIEVEHIPGSEQKADILTNALARIKYKVMRDLIGVRNVEEKEFNFEGENVGTNLKIA